MAADYDGESSSLWFKVQLRQIVQHIDGYSANFENFRLSKLESPRSLVDIAPRSGQRRDRGQLLKNLWCAHIPGVNDVS